MAGSESKRTRRISELQRSGETGYRVHLPDGTTKSFKTAEEALRWFNTTYPGNNYYMTRAEASLQPASQSTLPETPARQPHFASEDLPIYISSGRTGIDRYMGAAAPSPLFQRAYDRIGMNPITSDTRVENMYRAWKNNPEAMQLWTDAGDAAAAFTSIPLAAVTAPIWVPYAANMIGAGLKWRYTTPSGWLLGGAAELPNLALAADNLAADDNAQGDGMSRIRRIWDYAWDNPGKTFMTLAGLQAAYNWANDKWGTPPEWKHGDANPNSKALVPYDADYANKTKSLPRRLVNLGKRFFKNNWLSVPAAIYGAVEFGDWLFSNPDESKNSTTLNQNDSTKLENVLPAGFRPIQGINDSGQVVVPSSSRKPDSVINIEPVTRNRFGRGENLDQQ